MGFIFRNIFILICVFFFSETLYAQSDLLKKTKPFFSEKGFLLGYGFGLYNYNIPEGNYQPVLLMGHFGITPFKSHQQSLPGIFSIFFEPQINPVFIKDDSHKIYLEMGLNIGLQHLFPLYKKVSVYAMISSGPHVINVQSINQASGFIFSDNMGTGLYYFITKKSAINLGFRIRHISNANLAMPNGGINTYNFYLGFSKCLY
jgi:hypothetical protein